MGIGYYVLSGVLMTICFCAGVFTEKHFADEEIKMLKARKVRPATVLKITPHGKAVDFPPTDKLS